jgi:hypothetical protein
MDGSMMPLFPYPPRDSYRGGPTTKTYVLIDGLIHSRHRQGFHMEQYAEDAQLAYLIGWFEGEKTRSVQRRGEAS